MLRHICILALCLVCVGAASAVETPLTLNLGRTDRILVLDPAYGSMNIYEVSQNNTKRILSGRQANFIADVEMRLKTYPIEQDGIAYQELRIGNGTKPTYGDMFGKLMSDKPTTAETRAGKKALRWRALAAENAFWKGELAYDGIVRAAVSDNGQYLLLAVPALHTLLLYQIDGEKIELAGFRNIGPELLMTSYQTKPDPNDLLRELLRKIPKEREAEVRSALGLEAADGAKPDTGGGAGIIAAEEPPTPKSDLWVGPGSNNTFVVIDLANARAMLYQSQGLILVSVRDLQMDLKIPGLAGGSFKSDPAGEDLIKLFLQQNKGLVERYGLPTSLDEIKLLVGKRQPKGTPSPFDAASSNGGFTVANFISNRVLLTFEHRGGQYLNLVGARDYTLDVAVTLLSQEIQNRERAKRLLGSLGGGAGDARTLLNLRQVLELDPALHPEAEKRLKNAFKRDAALQAELQALLDAAATKAAALAKEAEERRKAVEDLRRRPR